MNEESSGRIILESLCHKQGKQWKSWKQRMLRLTESHLSYHLPNGTKKMIKQLRLTKDVHDVRMTASLQEKYKNAFEIHLESKRVLKISVQSEDLREEWIRSILQAKDLASGAGASSMSENQRLEGRNDEIGASDEDTLETNSSMLEDEEAEVNLQWKDCLEMPRRLKLSPLMTWFVLRRLLSLHYGLIHQRLDS